MSHEELIRKVYALWFIWERLSRVCFDKSVLGVTNGDGNIVNPTSVPLATRRLKGLNWTRGFDFLFVVWSTVHGLPSVVKAVKDESSRADYSYFVCR